MDLSDWLFPLLLLGGAIVQWVTSNRESKDESSRPPTSSPRTTRDEPTTTSPANEWDELLEALGQKEIPTELPQEQSSPPPIPNQSSQQDRQPTPYVDPLEARRRELEKTQRQLAEVNSSGHLVTHETSSTVDKATSKKAANLRRVLANRSEVRQAILLNEILQPPVSLR
ncbi:MAG: hypothetical protein AAF558_07270 [Verrucomicrobiota bacterium]